MALVVEDGTIVSGANSYVSDSDYTTWATARGYTVGATAGDREAELIKAMDVLESYRYRFKGYKSTEAQPLQWPRYSVWLDGYQLDSNQIPDELKKAQMELAFLSISTDLTPSGSIENVQSQSLGDMSISYFSGGTWKSVQMEAVDNVLKPLLNSGSGGMRSIRV